MHLGFELFDLVASLSREHGLDEDFLSLSCFLHLLLENLADAFALFPLKLLD